MQSGLSVSFTEGNFLRGGSAAASFTVGSVLAGNQMKLRITDAGDHMQGVPVLTGLTADGTSILNTVSDPTGEERAANLSPGQVAGSGVGVSGLSGPLDVGARYFLSYEVLGASQGTTLSIPSSGGVFAPGTLTSTPSIHGQIVTATSASGSALFTVDGSANFGFVSCRKAEWSFTVPERLGPERASNTSPGRVIGNGSIVSGLVGPLSVGNAHRIAYEVTGDEGTSNLYYPANAGSPFGSGGLPFSLGSHNLTRTALDTDEEAVVRVVGDLTFSSFSVRELLGIGGSTIAWTITLSGQKSGIETIAG